MAQYEPWKAYQDPKSKQWWFYDTDARNWQQVRSAPGLDVTREIADQAIKFRQENPVKPQAPAGRVAEFEVPRAQEQQSQMRSGIGQLLKESAIPAGMGAAGLMMGGIPGAVGGGMLGEAANQALGISEPDPMMIGVSGAAEALPVVGRTLKAGAKKVARAIPGVKAVLKQPIIEGAKALPARFRPIRPSREIYATLRGIDEANVKFPNTIETLKETGISEEGVLPFLQHPELKRAAVGAEETLTSAIPEQRIPGRTETSSILQEGGTPFTREIPEQVIPGVPDQGIPFEKAQKNLSRLGQRIHAAEKGTTMEDAGALRKVRQAMLDDMDVAAEHLPILKEANQTFKREMALEDLQSIIERHIKRVEGKPDLRDINAAGILNDIELITNKANPKDYDRLFHSGLGSDTIKQLVADFDKINDFGRITFNIVGPASLVTQGALGYAGAQIGQATGIPGAGLLGTIAGASLPYLISESLTRPSLRPLVLRMLKESSGKVTKPEIFMAVLGAALARSPRMEGDTQ